MKQVSLVLFLIVSNNVCGFKLGLEAVSNSLVSELSNKRVALVTNQTGFDQRGNRNVDLLVKRGVSIDYLCAPEHGLFGVVPAGKAFGNQKDQQTGIGIISLYKQDAHRAIDPQLLNNIDVFIFDIQDAGMRHYTYISTLYKLIEAAVEHHKQIVVLDRPNLLGPVMEGPLVDKQLHSFIGIAPIPVRHGMTVGELAQYFNKYFFNNKAHVTVVPLVDYKRTMKLNGYWPAALSPNIPDKQSLYGYSFLGLLGEVGPFEIGVGTEHPFQRIMLPSSLCIKPEMWDRLKTVLANLHVTSSWCHYVHPIKKRSYVGLKIKIDDIAKISTMKTLIAILDFFKDTVSFEFKLFDKSIGSLVVREYVQNKKTKELLQKISNDHLDTFVAQVQTVMLYEPAPYSVVL